MLKKDEDSIIFVMDKKTTTYRNELLESYKAQRPETPEKYIQQIPYIYELVENLGIKVIAMDNYEADDVIASIVEEKKNLYDKVYIITSDKDMMQLVKDNVFILRPEKALVKLYFTMQKKLKIKWVYLQKKNSRFISPYGRCF